MGGGPKSWNGAKRRLKRPETDAAKRAKEGVDIGRVPRKLLSRPESTVKPLIAKSASRPLHADEKRLKSLNKLLRSIEDLQRREKAGETLDEQQEQKLARLDDVLDEMEQIMSGGK